MATELLAAAVSMPASCLPEENDSFDRDLPPPPPAAVIVEGVAPAPEAGDSHAKADRRSPGTEAAPSRPPLSTSKQRKSPESAVRQSRVPVRTDARAPMPRQLGGTPGTRLGARDREAKRRAALAGTPARKGVAGEKGVKGVHPSQQTPRQTNLKNRQPAGTPGTRNGGGGTSTAQPTPRQAAMSAKKLLADKKQREGALFKQQQMEMKSAAKAQQAERMAEQQRALKERAAKAQRQRVAAAAAKKAEREKKAETQSLQLQTEMDERKEWKDTLLRNEKERRRTSLAYRNVAWCKEREMKRVQREARHEEQRLLMEGHNTFLEAKSEVREEQELSDKRERIWRARRDYLHKTLQEGEGDMAAYEALQLRKIRALDQEALDEAAQEEKRLRRTSAQWRRNKRYLDREIERGMGGALDPFKMADDLYWKEESRMEDREFKEAQKALRRESRMRRRRSDVRRQGVEESIRLDEEERQADLKASQEGGMMDAAKYREDCIRRERESLDGRRQKLHHDKALEQWTRELSSEVQEGERELTELVRQDGKAHEEELVLIRKAEEERQREEQINDRLYKRELELIRKQEEVEERRILLEDRESVSASKKKEQEAETDRREALRELPSDKTKLEILEAIWARQAHPAAAAAARGRRRLTLKTVQEFDPSQGDEGGGRPAVGRRGISPSSVGSSSSGSSSGMGIHGRVSDASSIDSLLVGWRESRADADRAGPRPEDLSALGQSGIGLGSNVRLSVGDGHGDSLHEGWSRGSSFGDEGVSDEGRHRGERDGEHVAAPAWGDVSAIENQQDIGLTITEEAAAVLAAAEQSFETSSVDSGDRFRQIMPRPTAAISIGTSLTDTPDSEGFDRARPQAETDYPVRALVFSELAGQDEAGDFGEECGIGAEDSDSDSGSGVGPCSSEFDDVSAEVAAVDAEGFDSKEADSETGGGSGSVASEVLMCGSEEAAVEAKETDREENVEETPDEGQETQGEVSIISHEVVSFEEEVQQESIGALDCESSVLGEMASRSHLASGTSVEDGALASLDGNEGSSSSSSLAASAGLLPCSNANGKGVLVKEMAARIGKPSGAEAADASGVDNDATSEGSLMEDVEDEGQGGAGVLMDASPVKMGAAMATPVTPDQC